MDIPKGAKFLFFVVPVFAFSIVLILILFSNKEKIAIEPENGEDIYGSNQEQDEDFKELSIEILEEGSGKEAKAGDRLSVHYTGTLKDGTQFDSSYDRGEPYTFVLGIGEVIDGWDQGLVGMKIGEKRKLEIPSSLGYGSNGSGIIPPNAGLIFEIELLTID
jgi:FKBP-type peptidyl-prolyl cis-trans isomerase